MASISPASVMASSVKLPFRSHVEEPCALLTYVSHRHGCTAVFKTVNQKSHHTSLSEPTSHSACVVLVSVLFYFPLSLAGLAVGQRRFCLDTAYVLICFPTQVKVPTRSRQKLYSNRVHVKSHVGIYFTTKGPRSPFS